MITCSIYTAETGEILIDQIAFSASFAERMADIGPVKANSIPALKGLGDVLIKFVLL